MLELQLPSILQLLSCDHGAESIDFLSSILSVNQNKPPLESETERAGGLEKHFFRTPETILAQVLGLLPSAGDK